MTFSIIGRDPATGQIGVAVASRFLAAGAVVPYTRGDCAVATQAFVNPMWGVEGLPRLAAGAAAEQVLAELRARDGNAGQRQVHMLDRAGRFACWTGEGCMEWTGHAAGTDCSAAGNMLAGPDVVAAMVAAFEAARGTPLAERLIRALEAGERAGGDRRGRQSAGIRVHRGEDYPWLDFRADDHPDPIGELRRLLAVAEERYLHIAETMGTRADFTGMTDRAPVDAAIREAEARRAAAGIGSRSFATPLA